MINCSFRGTNISPTKNGSLLGKGRRRANVSSYEPVKLKKINPWRTVLTKLYEPGAYIVLPTLISCTRIYLLRYRGIYLFVCLFRYILRLLPFMQRTMCQPHCWDTVHMSVCQSQDSVQSPNTPESQSSVANPLPSPVWVCFIRRPPWKGGGRWPPIGLSEKWASRSMLTIFQHGLEWRSPSITKITCLSPRAFPPHSYNGMEIVDLVARKTTEWNKRKNVRCPEDGKLAMLMIPLNDLWIWKAYILMKTCLYLEPRLLTQFNSQNYLDQCK